MSLESKISKNVFQGNGTTKTFSFTFRVWKEDQVLVYVGIGDETETDVTSSCSITLSENGGTVTFPTAPAVGMTVVIMRNMPFTQEDQYITGARFDPHEIEDRLDQDCAERQQLLDGVERAVKVPVTSNKTPDQYMSAFWEAVKNVLASIVEAGKNIGNSTYVTATGSDTPRTLADRFGDVVNVKDFGAVGDGVTDDTEAWEKWMAASGGIKYAPAGKYLVNGKVKNVITGLFTSMYSTTSYGELNVYVPQQAMSYDDLLTDGWSADHDGNPYTIVGELIVLKKGDTVIVIDSGGSNRGKMTKAFFETIGVDHVDYQIFSHYHYDHVTGFSGLTKTDSSGVVWSSSLIMPDYLDYSKCKFFLPVARHTLLAEVNGTVDSWDPDQERDQAVLEKLAELGKIRDVDYFYPSDLQELEIDETLKLTFLNAGIDALKEVYAINASTASGAEVKINDLSMCVLVEHERTKMFFSGDIERAAEIRLRKKMILISQFLPLSIGNNRSDSDDNEGGDGDTWGDSDYGIQYAHDEEETVYEKINRVHLYKLSHHGQNYVTSNTDYVFYKLLRPQHVLVVTEYGDITTGDNGRKGVSNQSCFRDSRLWNAYYELTHFVSRGNGVECINGQEDSFLRHANDPMPGDSWIPMLAHNSGGTGRWWEFLGVRFKQDARKATFLLHISATRSDEDNSEGMWSGLYEIKISKPILDTDESPYNFSEDDTYISTIYEQNPTSSISDFRIRDYLRIAYYGNNYYAIVMYKASTQNQPKVTLVSAQYMEGSVDVYRVFENVFWRYSDASGAYQLYKSKRGDKTPEQHDVDRVTYTLYAESDYPCGRDYTNLMPWVSMAPGNPSDLVDNFDNISVRGRYHFRALVGTTLNCPDGLSGNFDGEIQVDYFSAASSISTTTRKMQRMTIVGPSAYKGSVFIRMTGATGTWSDWIYLPSNVPIGNGIKSLGDASHLWSQLYAAAGSINTSDAKEKQAVESYPDAVLDAWGDVEFRQFLFNDAVEKKGAAARLHSGVIAQQVVEAFTRHGVDATRYGLLCYDEWPDEYETVEVEDTPAVFDADGNEVTPAQTHKEKVQTTKAGSRYGIRYSEALCLEAAYQRRRAQRLEESVDALETRIAAVEALMTNAASKYL